MLWFSIRMIVTSNVPPPKIEDEDGLILVQLIEPVGERPGRRLV